MGSRSDKVGGKPAGVQVRPANYAKFAVSLTLGLNVEQKKEAAFYSFLLQQVGKPYNRKGIIGIALGRDWNAIDSFFCSQLMIAGEIASQIVPETFVVPSNRVNPDTLVAINSALGGFVIS